MILKKISERTGISEAFMIREGIDMAIQVYIRKMDVLRQLDPKEIDEVKKLALKIEHALEKLFK